MRIIKVLYSTVITKATYWQRHCDDRVPRARLAAFYTKVHSLAFPTRVHRGARA